MKPVWFLFLVLTSLILVNCSSNVNLNKVNNRVENDESSDLRSAGIINGGMVRTLDPIAKHIVAITSQILENCTGTLIAENLVLTAAYCETPNEKMYVAFDLEVSESNIDKIDFHEVKKMSTLQRLKFPQMSLGMAHAILALRT